jgi:hypothetical protein
VKERQLENYNEIGWNLLKAMENWSRLREPLGTLK